jgi:hypothetical protein
MSNLNLKNCVFFCVLLLHVVCSPIHAQFSTNPLQLENPAIFQQNQNWNANMGYRFTANSDGNITALGGRWADGAIHTVRLYAYPSGTLLASANVTGSTNWNYTSLATPVAISSGNDYVVAVRVNNLSGLYSNMALPVNTGGVTIVSSMYRLFSNNMPNSSSSTTMYGQADFTFEPCVYAGNINSSNNNFAPGDSAALTLSNNVGSIQWQVSTDGVSFSDIPAATSSALSTGPLSASTFYRTYVSNSGCVSDTSAVFAVNVVDPFLPLRIHSPVVTNQEINWNYNMGYRFTALKNGTINALGGKWKDGVVHTVRLYAYPSGTVLATANVTGSMNWNYATLGTPVNLTSGNQYIVAVRLDNQSSGCYAVFDTPVTSNGIEITRSVYRTNSNAMPNQSSFDNMYGMADVRFVPCSFAGEIVAAETNILRDDSTTLTVVGNTTSIQWQRSADGVSFTNISGATSTTINTGALAQTTYFRTITTIVGCGIDTSSPIKIAVIDPDYPLQSTKVAITERDLNYNYNMGYRFTALSNGSVTELGGRWADGVTHTVRLYAYPSGTVLASTNVVGSYDWNYATLGTPVNLTAGNQYVVAVRLNNQSSGVRSIMNTPVTSGQIRIDDAVFRNSSNAIPNSTSSNTMYGQADLKFEPCVFSGVLLNSTPSVCPGETGMITSIEYAGNLQWQSSTNKLTWSNVIGATSATLTTTALITTTYFRLISSAACGADTSANDSVIVIGSSGGSPGLWTALDNTNWNNACNWSDGTVPTTGSRVIIPAGTASPTNVPTITLASLRIENASGIALSNNMRITDTLYLINGSIMLNNNHLTLAPLVVILGGYSTSHVHTNGSGELRKEYNSANGNSFTFPVGGDTYFAPVQLAINSGSAVGSGAYIGVKTIDASHPLLVGSSDYLDRYWSLSSNAISNPDYSVDFQYNDQDVVGLENTLLGAGYNSGWTKYNAVDINANTFSVSNITNLGDFSASDDVVYISQQNGNWATPSSWQGGIAPSSPSENVRILATHTITVSGNQSVNEINVDNGGMVELSGTLTVMGNLNMLGNFSGTGTVVFSGTSAQTIDGSEIDFPSLTVNNNSGVTLQSGNHTLTGTLSLNSGTFNTNNGLTLISNSTGTARVAPISAGSITGNVTMQRYIDSGPTNWRFLGSPISNGFLSDWDNDFITSGFPGSDFPSFPFVSVYRYDETALGTYSIGYTAPGNASDPLQVGEGYWVWCGDTSTGTQPFTIDLTGNINTGNITLPITYTNDPAQPASQDGWNMVSNPYPSSIDWDDANWTKLRVNNAIYIWNPDNQQYASYVNGAGVNSGSRYIASSQAFWVQTNGASPSLIARENVKSTTDQAFLKSRRPDPIILVQLNGNGFQDETILRFNAQASDAFDEALDARKLFSSHLLTPALYTELNGETLSINSIDTLYSDLSIPLMVNVGKTNSHTFTIRPTFSINDYSCVIFEDRELGVSFTVNADTTYTCVISDTATAKRFWLHLGAPIPQMSTDPVCFDQHNGQIAVKGTGKGPWDYHWYDRNGMLIVSSFAKSTADTLSNLNAGSYSVIIDSNGVCGQSQLQFDLTDPDPVNANFEADSVINLSRTSQLQFTNRSLNANTYKWDFGDGMSSHQQHPLHTYQQTGAYRVSLLVKGKNGCEDSAVNSISVVDDITSNHQHLAPNEVIVYPNPCKGEKVFFNEAISGTLFRTNGQVIRSFDLTKELDVTFLNNGSYFIQTTSHKRIGLVISR